jgi:cytoskeletal protein RodZ
MSNSRSLDANSEAAIGRFRDAVKRLSEARDTTDSTGASESSNSLESQSSAETSNSSVSLKSSSPDFDVQDLNGTAANPEPSSAIDASRVHSMPVKEIASEQPPARVAAEQFVLVDKSGKTRAALEFKVDGSPALTLHDTHGRTRASIFLGADGAPSIVFYDAAGKRRLEVALKTDGAAGVGLYDRTGGGRAELAISESGGPALCLFGPDGRRITKLPSSRGR